VARFGARALLAAAGALVLAGPLTVLALLVRQNSSGLHRIDESIEEGTHAFVLARPALAQTLNVGSTVLHPRVMWVLVGATALVLWRRGRRRHAVWAVVTIAVGATLDTPLKELMRRARPVFDVPVATAPGYSFPSGHALNSMVVAAVAVVLWWPVTRGRPWRRAALLGAAALLVLATGFDRVGLGVHYPSDVVGGWLIALAVVLVTTAAFHTGVAPRERDAGEPADPSPRSDS
jgi:membrane-associated phospholipid phosphatase